MLNSTSRRCLLGSVALGLLSVSSQAWSQAQSETAPQASERTYDFGDIVVTARRTAESLQTVPITITAFDQARLRQASVTTAQDLMFLVPGVYLTGANSRENATYFIRGQGKPPIGPGSPAVVAYFAEVPLNIFGSGGQTYDIGSIQVLKGPQGTLFGRNTTGGAVLLGPAAPTDNFEGYVQGSYGNYDYKDVEGAINIPIVQDKAALRIAGRVSRRDGYTHNLGTQGDLDSIHSDQVRASLKLNPTDWLTNLTIFDFRHTNQTASGAQIIDVQPFPPAPAIEALLRNELALQRARGPRTVDYGATPTSSEQHHYTIVNRTEVDMGAVQFVNIFGYQTLKWSTASNVDGLQFPIIDALVFYNQKTVTNEVQLRGTLMDDKVEWLVGGFYYNNTPNGLQGGDFDAFFTNAPLAYDYSEERSRAAFGNVVWHLDDLAQGLSVNAGFRYTWDKTKSCIGSGELSPPYTVSPGECSPTNPTFIPGTGSVLRTKSSAPTWTVGADWKLNSDTFVYAVTRRGYRAGGIGAPRFGGVLAPFQFFKPEKVTDIEIGARTEWRAGDVRGRFNISGYVADTKGAQVGLPGFATQPGCVPGSPQPVSPDGDCNGSNDPSGTLLVANVGDKRITGVDLEAMIQPLAGLQFGATASFLHQSTRKFALPAALALYGSSFNGKIPLISSAKKSGTIYGRYELPLDESIGKISFGANHYWSGGILLYTYQTKSYSLTDLRLDWQGVMGSGFDLAFYAKNIFDKDQPLAGGVTSPALPFTSVVYNEPRTYGLQLRYRFGV